MKLTVERLREVVLYDPATGRFTYRTRHWARRPGAEVGYVHSTLGYRCISIDGIKNYAHRLAWLYVHGVWPAYQIDHINGDGADNRLVNLREASHAMNKQNVRTAFRNNQAGLLGAGTTRNGKYRARIGCNGVARHLGTFPTAELAHKAYVAAKRKIHAGNTL